MSLSQDFVSVGYTHNLHYVMYVMLEKDGFEFVHSIIIIIICPLTVRVVGAPQMIWQPDSSIFPVLSGTWRTPGLDVFLPLLLLPARFLPPFHGALPRGFARPDQGEKWPYHCSLPLFTIVKEVFMWYDCLLNFRMDILVGNTVFVGNA